MTGGGEKIKRMESSANCDVTKFKFRRKILTFEDVLNCNFLSAEPSTNYFVNRKPWRRGQFFLEFLKLVYSIVRLATIENVLTRWGMPKSQVAFFLLSKNNYDSVRNVQKLLSHSFFMSAQRSLPWGHLLPAFPIALISTIALPYMLYRLMISKAHVRKAISGSFRDFTLTYGQYYWALTYLSYRRPKGVVFSNDHVAFPRALRLACERLRVPTFFIPHGTQDPACIPALKFDFALLDGRATLKKYADAGIAAQRVHLVGIPKFDSLSHAVNRRTKVKTIGIATNAFTPLADLHQLIAMLSEHFPFLEMIIRPHPAQDPRELRRLADRRGFPLSDSRVVSSLAFLSSIDAIIAGDSGILLEAAFLNVYPIYFSPFGQSDMLGFVGEGLATQASDGTQLASIIRELSRQKQSVRYRCNPFVEGIGNEREWKAAQVAADLIVADLNWFQAQTRSGPGFNEMD